VYNLANTQTIIVQTQREQEIQQQLLHRLGSCIQQTVLGRWDTVPRQKSHRQHTNKPVTLAVQRIEQAGTQKHNHYCVTYTATNKSDQACKAINYTRSADDADKPMRRV